jgi:hexosaminidase
MKRVIALVVVVALAAVVTVLLIQNGTAMNTPVATVIPRPVSQANGNGTFSLEGAVATGPLAGLTGLPTGADGNVVLAIAGDHRPGGYALEVTINGVRIEAADEAGLFAGIQTLKQLTIDNAAQLTRIDDYPRFQYRGAMLDVARHFFSVTDVKRYIDDIAMLKLNYLHLHLTDDQGWRLQIDSWPALTGIGASTQVNGGGGGFYTKDDFREIVAYAAAHFITVVPEIDVPGHTNAALSAYPELSCDGVAPPPYEGIEVGFSSLCIGSDRTYEFLDDVVRELVELTPGPYIHLGGDESLATTDEEFLAFIARATALAAEHGKTIIGWHEMGRSAELPAGTIGQYWSFTTPQEGAAEHTFSFVEQGGRVIMSPADVAYLDMQYPDTSEFGLVWANGPTSVREAYEWDPAAIIDEIRDEQLLGVEAPVWTETLATIDDVEFMAFPRIAAIAEVAWSPAGGTWTEFEPRLVAFGKHLDGVGVNYYRTPEVPWRD